MRITPPAEFRSILITRFEIVLLQVVLLTVLISHYMHYYCVLLASRLHACVLSQKASH